MNENRTTISLCILFCELNRRAEQYVYGALASGFTEQTCNRQSRFLLWLREVVGMKGNYGLKYMVK
jgi:hypothetical protein